MRRVGQGVLRRPSSLLIALATLACVGVAGCSKDVAEQPAPASVPLGTAAPGWHRVEAQGVALRVPGEWVRQDLSACEFDYARFGPADADPCVDGAGVGLFASATFDPGTGPGELVALDGRIAGWVSGTDEIDVDASAETRNVLEQVLASARPASERAYARGRWRDRLGSGLRWRYPAYWDLIDSACASSWARAGARAPDVEPLDRGGCWTGQRNVGGTSSLIRVKAPSQALAQLVLGSARPTG